MDKDNTNTDEKITIHEAYVVLDDFGDLLAWFSTKEDAEEYKKELEDE